MRRIRRGPVIAVSSIVLVALLVPVLPLPDPMRVEVAQQLAPPSLAHWLGQDQFGRDVLSRLLWSARASLVVAIASAGLACLLGIAIALYGTTRAAAARGMYVLQGFPPLLLALFVVTVLGPGAGTLIAVLAIIYLPDFVRIGDVRVQPVRPVLVKLASAATSAMTLESGLSFLGLGIVPPMPSWGLMIADARGVMTQAPLLLIWPCAALSLTIFTLNELCKALRQVLEPQQSLPPITRSPAILASPPGRQPTGGAVLDVRGMSIDLETSLGTLHPVRDVSFTLRAGETLAIVGESGSGKSLAALALLGLLPEPAHVTSGSAWLQGHNLLRLDQKAFGRVRGGVLSIVLQDAQSSFNPMQRIGAQIREAMQEHFAVADHEAKDETLALLSRVGISDAKSCAQAYPHELSHEMRLRALIAMAIANDPRLLILDEPTTALDPSIQAQIFAMLTELRRELGMGVIFITRHLSAATEFADHVLLMHAGEIVEQGTTH